MQCAYFDAGVCRSCSLMGLDYELQLERKLAHCRSLLAEWSPVWLPAMLSREDRFRNKAKMVVGGTPGAPTLGILDVDRRGVDLEACGVLAPGLRAAFPAITAFIGLAGLVPYDVNARRGELKHVLLTESPDGELQLRWVLRSTESVARIRKHLPALVAALPQLAVVSVNLQPEHKAVLEGPDELLLTDAETLAMRTGDLTLHLRPGSFFQTNTAIAAGLYAQAAEWVDAARPASVWDLYCGVGGFALHVAAPGRRVLGVETSAPAVASALLTASEAGLGDVDFAARDATEFAEQAPVRGETADLVIVNPPRRGLGSRLCAALEAGGAATIVYSSCNAESLARDLRELPSFEPAQVRLFDMFPQTEHYEVMVLLER
jgi:23S rRNA (uracil747-C5)-methyltransferase